MTEMFGEAWSPMSVPDLAPDDDETATLNLPLSTVTFLTAVKRKDSLSVL